ncbi:hypothetical protein JXR01_02525 [Candidatus Kaiserbacteria bacterium]|nr:MAG: hypothetical protein JXR01_02525 [Candidatus Kaiserbacteria bacterium]
MIWSFRAFSTFLILVVVVFFSFVQSAQAIVAVPDLRFGQQGCEIIDANWKEYGENIRGANTKVSDVVLNACEAIGGRNQCTFTSGCRYNEGDINQNNPECTYNTGVSNSQHRHNNAIDLKVTEGKEKEFITFAICGLRKVNNCEGGIGYYKSKSIHVDVRTGRTSIWSTGYKRTNISGNVRDPEAREILYSFGDGECVTGSISGDYTEEKEYGPVEEYTPPAEYSDEFKEIILTPRTSEYTPKNYFEELYQPISNIPSISFPNLFQPIGGGSTFNTPDATSQVFSDGLVYIDSEQADDTKPTGGGSLLDFLTNPKKQTEDDSQSVLTFDTPANQPSENNEVVCEGSGFLGTNFFKTCEPQQEETQANTTAGGNNSVVSNLVHNITKLTNGSDSNTADNTTQSGAESEIQKTIASDNSFDGFYATHIPNDGTTSVQQAPSVQADNSDYGQFVVGGRETIAPERVSSTPGKTVRFAEQSVLYGSYYGVVHTISPLLIGSTPRSLLRMTDGNDFTRVHNLFSI